MADNDNWDDDFVTAISPSALHLPHLKAQDNFGGLLSSDKLKAFASTNDLSLDTDNYDDDFEGELLTVKGLAQQRDETQERTLRPLPRKVTSSSDTRVHQRPRSSAANVSNSPSTGQSTPKARPNKFKLPIRPDLVYREQNNEDFSDLFVDNDHAFNRGSQVVSRVGSCTLLKLFSVLFSPMFMSLETDKNNSRARVLLMRRSYFIHPI